MHQHSTARPVVPAQLARSGRWTPDLVLELEAVVDQLARLVLHSTALAERMAGGPVGSSTEHRLQRLRQGADAARTALQAAVRVDLTLDSTTPQPPIPRQPTDRRQAPRRQAERRAAVYDRRHEAA